jgi:hypothetical protein
MQMLNKKVDFNSILTGANLLVAGFLVFAFERNGGNQYINQQTIVLGVVLSVQTHVALWFERRRRDPFSILLSFLMIFYYSLRLLTLSLYPFSVVFERYSYGASDSNYALTFIIVANVFLYAGFYLGRFKGKLAIDTGQWKATSPTRVVFLILLVVTFAYFTGHYWTEDNVPRVFNFLTIFVAQDIVLLMAMAYYFVFKQSLTKKVGSLIVAMIMVDIVVHTLLGSRSGIVDTMQNYILVALVIGGCVQVGRKYFILGIVFFPVLVALLIGSFAISTYNRAFRSEGTLDVSRAFDLAMQSRSELSIESTLDNVVPLIAARAGFFDFSAEIIAHKDEYASVINLSSYAKSIVDNLLTPGFDVYDQPKISNALQFVYNGSGSPSKEQVSESYQSDQLGIYGEFYALFGYASLPLFLLTAFLITRVYGRMRSENPFVLAMKRVVVLWVFVRTLNSYGFDWTLLETLPRIAAIYIYQFFFRSKLVPVGELQSGADLHRPITNSSVALPNTIAATGNVRAL